MHTWAASVDREAAKACFFNVSLPMSAKKQASKYKSSDATRLMELFARAVALSNPTPSISCLRSFNWARFPSSFNFHFLSCPSNSDDPMQWILLLVIFGDSFRLIDLWPEPKSQTLHSIQINKPRSNSPRSAEQKHFLANHNTRLSPSRLWRCAARLDEVPNVRRWIEAVQVVEVEVQQAVVSAEDVN